MIFIDRADIHCYTPAKLAGEFNVEFGVIFTQEALERKHPYAIKKGLPFAYLGPSPIHDDVEHWPTYGRYDIAGVNPRGAFKDMSAELRRDYHTDRGVWRFIGKLRNLPQEGKDGLVHV